MADILLYIGTYTQGESDGIYVYRMDPETGALEYSSTGTGVENPSFVTIAPGGRHLYAASEVMEFGGEKSGAVAAFSIDPGTGALTLLNQQSSRGTGPCHLSVEPSGKYAMVANYGGGSVAILPIQDDGSLGEATDFVQHEGSSVEPGRQDGPHAHFITPDPAGRFAFAADLGIDKILIYQIDLEAGKLKPGDPPWVQIKAGAGPRHFVFHPNGQYAYLITELDNTFITFAYDDSSGMLREVQTISTLPADFTDESFCADVHVAPSGKFVYGSNRGHESIAIAAVDQATSELTCVGYESTRGKFPRGFTLDPTGNFLLAANQQSDNIVVFRIDQETGLLEFTGHEIQVPMPVCLKMIQRD